MTPHQPPRVNLKVKTQYQTILAYLGLTLSLVGGVMLAPIPLAFVWPEEWWCAIHYLLPAVVLLGGGMYGYRRFRTHDAIVTMPEGGLIVVAVWAGACIAGAWPLGVVEELTFTQAVFEAVSGWTTTGLSVVDVTQAKHMTLFWRSVMQLVGGAGFAILMVAAMTGLVGAGLPMAEGRSEQLAPHVRQSAKLVLLMYSIYAAVGTGAYMLAGMTWFDAVNHAFAAVSTGGFSTRPESIGSWDSVAIEAVSLPLMFLGNFNFLTAYVLWRGRISLVVRDGEVRFVAVAIPLCASLLLLFVCWGFYPTFGKALRVAVFETVTCITTTGFSTVTYNAWNGFGILLLVVFMLVGGGMGSTAGGLKQFRVYLLTKAIAWDVRRALAPPSAVDQNYVWRGEQQLHVSDHWIREVAVFTVLYLLAYAVGTGVLAAHGIPLADALFEFASAQGTVGLSVGVTQAAAPRLVLWTEIAGMFLGRLEFLIVFVAAMKLVRDIPALRRVVEAWRDARREPLATATQAASATGQPLGLPAHGESNGDT